MIGESKQIIDENPIGEREKQQGLTNDRWYMHSLQVL